MRILYSFILLFLISFSFAQKKDNRTFQQISDSILAEAHTIYRYDKAFTMAMNAIEANKKLRKSAGEILVMPKNDTIYSLVFSAEKPEMLVAEMKFGMALEDSAVMAVSNRAASEEELAFYDLKHLVMSNVQAKYDVVFGDKETYLNPIFIPFKDKIGSKEIQLYKLYLTTETNASNTIPFGQDYLFIAKEDGGIFYNLQFNPYMPLPISYEMVENTVIDIEYPKREPYVTPTDIFLFSKYGTAKGLNTLRVKSTAFGVIFQYDWDRDELNVLMPEEEPTIDETTEIQE